MSLDLDSLALRLHELFAVGGRIHLLQQPDGQYHAIRRRLSVGRIRKMLESHESIAAFQFCNGVTRWICLDFDLHRNHIVDGEVDLTAVLDATRRCSHQLREIGVKHLVEFSGNRGFHVWVLFSEQINRDDAYRLLDAILVRCGLDGDLSPVKIDRYPASPKSRSNRGRGVKIPLSKHVKSGGYAYLVPDIGRFELVKDTHITELDSTFVEEQIKFLNTDIVCERDETFAALGLKPTSIRRETLSPTYLRVSLRSQAPRNPTLDDVLCCLRRCKCVDGLLDELQNGKNPDEDTRVLLVGMFARLESADHPNLGLDLLHEFFAKLPGYDRPRTEEKLRALAQLRPPTCEQIRTKLPQLSCDCEADTGQATSPVQYLSDIGVEIVEADPFEFTIAEARAVRNAQQRYTRENDEIALYWTERELENLNDIELEELCKPTDLGPARVPRFHEFDRIEDGDSKRRLVALSSRDKIWTTARTLILNDLVYQGFSGNSYGYRISPHLAGGRIFEHWLRQWKAFTSHLGELIYSPEYAEWGLLKIDIKSFYDNINLERLRVKLYDGPTPPLRRHYRTLPDTLRDKYRRVIDDLVNACGTMTPSELGVPQGPAFARFLAEVYLMDFDALVERHPQVAPDHYARYVDDIFVIVPPHADLVDVERELLHHIGTLGLRHNPDKHFRGTVKDYRGAFAEYWQETKYFVDQVSRQYNSAPPDEIRRAARELYSLVMAGDSGELNKEHLSFLYTHLSNDPSMNAFRSSIEDYVLGLHQGRGSLFDNFFRHYLAAWQEAGYPFRPNLAKIDGLRKECFLNLLLAKLSESPIADEDALKRIRSIVDALTENAESELEMELAGALRLHDVRIAGQQTLEDMPSDNLLYLTTHNFPKSIPEDIEMDMRNELLRLPFAPFVGALSDIIFNETHMRPDFLGGLLDDFRNKALDAISEAKEANLHLEVFDAASGSTVGDLPNRYYQLCCLSSVSAPASRNHNAVLQEIWGNFILTFNKYPDPPFVTSRWVTKLDALHLDDTSVNLVLTRGIGDVVQGVGDKHGIFLDFYQQFVLDQMGVSEDEQQHPHGNVNTDVGDRVRAAVDKEPERWPLLSWVFNKTPSPHYAPNREECLSNIATNAITVLRSGNEVLVRRRPKPEPKQHVSDLSNYSIKVDQLQGKRYVCETFLAAAKGYATVESLFCRSKGLLEVIEVALNLRNGAQQFSEKHRPVGSEHMANIFATGAKVRVSDCFPELPQLVLGEKLVTPHGERVEQSDNNPASFDKALYKKITQCGQSLLGDEHHPAEVSAGQLDTHLVAPWGSASGKLEFLEAFHGQWKKMSYPEAPDAFEMELCKVVAIQKLLNTASGKVASSEAFFERYLGLRQEANRHIECLLLLSDQNQGDLNTIESVYRIVRSSLVGFFGSVNQPDPTIDKLLAADLERLNEALLGIEHDGDGLPKPIDFKQGVVSIDPYRGGVRIDDIDIQGADADSDERAHYSVLELAYLDCSFQQLTAGHHQMLENAGSRVFHAQWQEMWLLVVLPRAVYKAATIAIERRKEFGRINGGDPKEHRKLWCYVNRKSAGKQLHSLQKFQAAVEVVAANHPNMEDDDSQRHLEDWLLNMPEGKRDLLTRVIAAHEPIRAENEQQFVDTLESLSGETIVFSLTTADDVGGWHRLLIRTDERVARTIIGRASKVESDIAKAVEGGTPYEVAIVTDIVVAGGQILDGLKEHYFAESPNPEKATKKHYFNIGNSANFKEGVSKARRIRIITARYSEAGEDRIKGPDGLQRLLDNPEVCITLEGAPIPRDRCFLDGTGLESKDQEAFKKVICDYEFVKRTFRIESSFKFYKNSVSNKRIERTNLITRRGSVPKWSAMIFRLPLNSGYPALFAHVAENNESGG